MNLSSIPLWLLIYGLPLFSVFLLYTIKRRTKTRISQSVHNESQQAGLTEPASLHPIINESRCLGCGSCVKACPEKKVLGLINNKANLISPSTCIGHGACKTACPFDAITLVFGTSRRGVDIPLLKPDYETNVPGIYIAGELGGMGLIRNAIRQGALAIDNIARSQYMKNKNKLDIVIVGAGPAGLTASLGAIKHKLRFITVDQESFGGTVSNFPRGKIVMTAPAELPIVGKMLFRETTKEILMAFWEDIRKKTKLEIQTKERVDKIETTSSGFEVFTDKGQYQTSTVLLTIGRRGTPRKLGVPGEELSKVVYCLIDPEQYRGKKVLIVGGGDSALEAAISIADEDNTTVSISYRSEAFSRAKPKNREKIEQAVTTGKLHLLMKSTVKSITKNKVILNQGGNEVIIDNDAIIVNAGGILPTPFLKSIGIEVETKYGTA